MNITKFKLNKGIAVLSLVATMFFLSAVPVFAEDVIVRTYTPSVKQTTATLEGYVKSEERVVVWFEYVQGVHVSATTRSTISGDKRVSKSIRDLIPGRTYSYRLLVMIEDTGRLFVGNTVDFNTVPDEDYEEERNNNLSTDFATVYTKTATSVDGNSAILNGYIDTKDGENSTRWFEWGTTQDLGKKTKVVDVKEGRIEFDYYLSGLDTDTRYYYRAVGTNDFGVEYGSTMRFTTSKQVVIDNESVDDEVDNVTGLSNTVSGNGTLLIVTEVRSPVIIGRTVTVTSSLDASLLADPFGDRIKMYMQLFNNKGKLIKHMPIKYGGGVYKEFTFSFSQLKYGEEYTYRAHAIEKGGDPFVYGEMVTFKIPPEPLDEDVVVKNNEASVIGSILGSGSGSDCLCDDDSPVVADVDNEEISNSDVYLNVGLIGVANKLSKDTFSFDEKGAVIQDQDMVKSSKSSVFAGFPSLIPTTFAGWAFILILIYIVISFISSSVKRKNEENKRKKEELLDEDTDITPFLQNQGIV